MMNGTSACHSLRRCTDVYLFLPPDSPPVSCRHTGRYRYRTKKTWFSGCELLILQVEISCIDFDPMKGHNEQIVWWRDANPRDLTDNDVIQWTAYIWPTNESKP
jgi:hypothetical protein